MRIRQIPITLDFPAEAPPCCCGGTGCNCLSLPDTLYAHLESVQYIEGDGNIYDTESVSFDLALEEGCENESFCKCANFVHPSSGKQWYAGFLLRSWQGCSGVAEKYLMDAVLQVMCVSGPNGTIQLQACISWLVLETCPDGYVWRYPLAQPTTSLTTVSCSPGPPGEVYASYEAEIERLFWINKLIVSNAPIS